MTRQVNSPFGPNTSLAEVQYWLEENMLVLEILMTHRQYRAYLIEHDETALCSAGASTLTSAIVEAIELGKVQLEKRRAHAAG